MNTRTNDNVMMVAQHSWEGTIIFSFIESEDGLYITSLSVSGYVDINRVRFEHKKKLYKIPTYPYKAYVHGDTTTYYNQTSIKATQCDNLEYLEWLDERRYRS